MSKIGREIVNLSEQLVEFVGEEYNEYGCPNEASGMCMTTSRQIHEMFDWDSRMKLVEVKHFNNPDGRFYELNQYANHYAVYIPEEKLVIDYTLRQFDPTTDFPFIGSKKKWRRVLEKAWDTKAIHETIHKR